MHVITQKDVENVIQKRIETGHKGTFGRISVIGGNANMGGAAIMAVQAAVKAGAGLTTCISHKANLTALHARVPEAMFIDYFDNDALCKSVSQSNVVVVGPGLGTDETAKQVFSSVLKNANQTLIIDGSAITMLAEDDQLKKLTPSAKIIFTPHEIEWQRLSGLSQAEQTPAKNAAKALELNADVVLKKHGTEIYQSSRSAGHTCQPAEWETRLPESVRPFWLSLRVIRIKSWTPPSTHIPILRICLQKSATLFCQVKSLIICKNT